MLDLDGLKAVAELAKRRTHNRTDASTGGRMSREAEAVAGAVAEAVDPPRPTRP
jgi:hypothetical protein